MGTWRGFASVVVVAPACVATVLHWGRVSVACTVRVCAMQNMHMLVPERARCWVLGDAIVSA